MHAPTESIMLRRIYVSFHAAPGDQKNPHRVSYSNMHSAAQMHLDVCAKLLARDRTKTHPQAYIAIPVDTIILNTNGNEHTLAKHPFGREHGMDHYQNMPARTCSPISI